MSSCTCYDMLKQSPLAKGRDDATIEEVAIWLDMNIGTNASSIIHLMKMIEKNFHDVKTDRIEMYAQVQAYAKSLCAYGLNGSAYAKYGLPMLCVRRARSRQPTIKKQNGNVQEADGRSARSKREINGR